MIWFKQLAAIWFCKYCHGDKTFSWFAYELFMLLRKYEYFMDKNMFWFTWNSYKVVAILKLSYMLKHKIESNMIHSESESELDFSFAINSVSDFDSTSNSDSDSESDFSSAFMNLYFLYPIFAFL